MLFVFSVAATVVQMRRSRSTHCDRVFLEEKNEKLEDPREKRREKRVGEKDMGDSRRCLLKRTHRLA